MEVVSYHKIKDYNDFCAINVQNISPEDLASLKDDAQKEIMVTGFTALFIQSKNLEVQPLHLTDVRDHFLKDFLSYDTQIQFKEHDIRFAVNYENESATMMDFLNYYNKLWKSVAEEEFLKLKSGINSVYFNEVNDFFDHVEKLAYDFSKSVLIDCELFCYKPSVLVCALMTASLEIALKEKLLDFASGKLQQVILMEIKLCNRIWDQIVKFIFGASSLPYLDEFGKYILVRQQRLFNTFMTSKSKSSSLANIYKKRVHPYYKRKLTENN